MIADEDYFDALIHEHNSQSLQKSLSCRGAPSIQEISAFASEERDGVHRRYTQTCIIGDSADSAIELNIHEAKAFSMSFGRTALSV
jgi:hypothetical protein